MPISTVPYKRTYKHTLKRGRETRIRCSMCGRLVPRWKTFTKTKGFRITDPFILKQVDKRMLHFSREKIRVCPKCARFYGIVEKGKSVRKKHMER
jgi:ribosomal protein S26